MILLNNSWRILLLLALALTLYFAVMFFGAQSVKAGHELVHGYALNSWWFWDANTTPAFDSYSVTMRPNYDATTPYYGSNVFKFESGRTSSDGGEVGGYFGFQTNTANAGNGKGVIFSIWDALDVEGPGFTGDFGGEGVGKTARLAYNWQAGDSYTFELSIHSETTTGRWWQVHVVDEASGHRAFVGRILSPTSDGLVRSNSMNTFLEMYWQEAATCSQLQAFSVTYQNPVGFRDGQSFEPYLLYLSDISNTSCYNEVGYQFEEHSREYTAFMGYSDQKVPANELYSVEPRRHEVECYIQTPLQRVRQGEAILTTYTIFNTGNAVIEGSLDLWMPQDSDAYGESFRSTAFSGIEKFESAQVTVRGVASESGQVVHKVRIGNGTQWVEEACPPQTVLVDQIVRPCDGGKLFGTHSFRIEEGLSEDIRPYTVYVRHKGEGQGIQLNAYKMVNETQVSDFTSGCGLSQSGEDIRGADGWNWTQFDIDLSYDISTLDLLFDSVYVSEIDLVLIRDEPCNTATLNKFSNCVNESSAFIKFEPNGGVYVEDENASGGSFMLFEVNPATAVPGMLPLFAFASYGIALRIAFIAFATLTIASLLAMTHKNTQLITMIASFGLIGVIILVVVNASSGKVVVELEQIQPLRGVTNIVIDQHASDGAYVQLER